MVKKHGIDINQKVKLAVLFLMLLNIFMNHNLVQIILARKNIYHLKKKKMTKNICSGVGVM